MIYRDAHINIINRFGDEAEARISAAQNTVNGSAFSFYDAEDKVMKPLQGPEVEEEDDKSNQK